MMNKTWTEDWIAFTNHLQDCIRKGISKEEICRFLWGKQVCWRGKLEQKVLEGEAPGVTFLMPARQIEIDADHKAILGVVTLPVADEDLAACEQARTGSDLQFSARFLDPDALFPAFDIHVLSSGRALIDIALERGRLEQSMT